LLCTLQHDHKDLASRLEKAVRQPSGRWDLFLKKGLMLRLPRQGWKAALARFERFQKTHTLPHVRVYDLRLRDRLLLARERPKL
jgi:cell division septal protein FtsQ